jgi:Tol biopolymer transport system component
LPIVRISVETGEQQRVTSPPPGFLGDIRPAVSPDGRTLAFVRASGSLTGDLYVVSLSGANSRIIEPRRVTFDGADISTPAWTASGRELIFASNRAGRRELWRIRAHVSERPVRVAGTGENAQDVAISPRGEWLAYSEAHTSGSLWKVAIAAGQAGKPLQVTTTTKRDLFPNYSPDGKRLVFQSDRSGVNEIWMSDADGGNAVQLTTFGKGWSGSPRWSPDSRTIAFDSNVGGSWDIYVIRSEGGRPVRLTTHPTNDIVPTWSRDGQWIYFNSMRTGRYEIWKIRPDGSSETQVTTGSGSTAVESPDGRYVYYTNMLNRAVFKMPVEGGPASKVLDSVTGRMFTITEHGFFFGALIGTQRELRFFDFATNSVRIVAPLSNWGYADVSPDERWAVYPRSEYWGTNIMLVENFR